MARKVMLIRHAEKPMAAKSPGDVPSYGLLETGRPSDYGLTVMGWQRAGALAVLFGREGAWFRSPQLVTPDIIFATAVSPRSRSLRMQQTIASLREKLAPAVAVNLDYGKGEEEQMINAALQSEGNVLICWSHLTIPWIAARILGSPNRAPRWPERRFDLIWVFDRQTEQEWSFAQVPQMLLAGDRADVAA
jgi:hypothetical protein